MEVKVLALISLVYFAFSESSVLYAVKDFIVAQKFPTKVSALICWKASENVKFSKLLASGMIQHEITNELKTNFFKIEHQFFLMDTDCNKSLSWLQKANELGLFMQPIRWLLFSRSSKKFELPHILNLLIDSRLWSMETCKGSNFCVKYLYKISKTEEFYRESIAGIWSPNKGFALYEENIFPSKKRVNLNGTLIKTSFVITNNDSLNHFWDYRNRHLDPISKVNYILVHHLMDFVNARKQFYFHSTWGYGHRATKTYLGMIGDLQKGVADLGGTPAFFTEDRSAVIEYIAFTTPARMKFILREPPLSYVANVFVMPFDIMVWYGCLIVMIVTPFALFVIARWEWQEPVFKKNVPDMHNALRGKFSDVIMFEIGAVSQQGYDVEPKSIAGRIAAIFTFITLMFLYTSYSANIVALLQSTTDSIRTVEDLLNSRISLGVEDIIYAHNFFEMLQDPLKIKLYETKIIPKGQPSNFMLLEEGIRRVRDEFFAFHVDLSTGYKVVGDIFMEHQKCGLREIEFFYWTEPWINVPRNSSYKEIFKIGYKRIQEHGIQNREVKRIYTRKPVCENRGSNFVNVGLRDCYFPFVLFSGGIAVSVFLLLVELAINKYYKHIKN